jgi:hypothetical protein|tara:strand:- start:62 stop:409 length:348 start_codon:yes stop_codon:yes gene_type:complete
LIDAVGKFNNYMTQHNDKLPLLSVDSIDDKRFVELRQFLAHIFGDIEQNAWDVSSHVSKLFSSLSSMEQKDVNTIINTFKKYEVKGESGGITGERTYGYDRSRVDRKLIRRRRPN